jgi:hypothetical protein
MVQQDTVLFTMHMLAQVGVQDSSAHSIDDRAVIYLEVSSELDDHERVAKAQYLNHFEQVITDASNIRTKFMHY